MAIEESIERSLKALPELLKGEMDKATLLIHTNQPPRPKSPRPLANAAESPPVKPADAPKAP